MPSQHSPLKLEALQRELSRRRLMPFVQRFNSAYKAGWVHEDICRRLERFSNDVAAEKSPRLMLLMPPRHGKSELASRNFPAWHLGRFPDHEFIACSYNLALAMTFSRKVKDILSDPLYQNVFGTRLDPNNQGAEAWTLAGAKGGYVAAGIGGPITGRGAHVLAIDDPVKNAEEADSADLRLKVWEWYLSTAYSRLAPGAGVLIIQTWWHDDDLAGRLQALMKAAQPEDEDFIDKFEVVKYPALAEADEWLDPSTDEIVRIDHSEDASLTVDNFADAAAAQEDQERAQERAERAGYAPSALKFLRAKGHALHPARYDIRKLMRIRAQNKQSNGADGRWWSALYQQNPVPDDGGYFSKDQFKRAEVPRRTESRVFIAWDFAITEKKVSDYTVGTVALQDYDDVLHVVDQVRFRSGDGLFIVESILNLAQNWHNRGLDLTIGFEDGQIYRAVEALLKKRMRERRFYPSTLLLRPITDKLARAKPLQGRMQQGMVRFATGLDCFESLRQEMLRFPAGTHDDQVDSLAWVAHMALQVAPPMRPKPKQTESWKDRLANGVLGATTHMAS